MRKPGVVVNVGNCSGTPAFHAISSRYMTRHIVSHVQHSTSAEQGAQVPYMLHCASGVLGQVHARHALHWFWTHAKLCCDPWLPKHVSQAGSLKHYTAVDTVEQGSTALSNPARASALPSAGRRPAEGCPRGSEYSDNLGRAEPSRNFLTTEGSPHELDHPLNSCKGRQARQSASRATDSFKHSV